MWLARTDAKQEASNRLRLRDLREAWGMQTETHLSGTLWKELPGP